MTSPAPFQIGAQLPWSEEKTVLLLENIRKGNYPGTAAVKAGIAQAAFNRLMDKGEKDDQDEVDTIHRNLFLQVRAAEADAEAMAVAHWTAAMGSDYKASRDYLARRFPTRWGANRDLNGTGGDGAITITITPRRDQEPEAEFLERGTEPEILAEEIDGSGDD